MTRKSIPELIQQRILIRSRRRCALCYGLHGDLSVKQGQIAHLNQQASSASEEDLVFLCFDHHDQYDSTTRQAKGLREGEVRQYRDDLYARVEEWASRISLTSEGTVPNSVSPGLTHASRPDETTYLRRLSVYRAAREYLSHIVSHVTVPDDKRNTYLASIDEALFLFGPDIDRVLTALYRDSLRLRRIVMRLEHLAGRLSEHEEEVHNLVEQEHDLLDALVSQLEGLRATFYPYLAR